MIQKLELQKVAKNYFKTPHYNGGMSVEGGVDCCTMIACILNELGAGIEFETGYSADWFCKRDCEELMLPYLKKYFKPVRKLRDGDVISYSWGRAKYAHLALVYDIEKGLVLHCTAAQGVELTTIDNYYFDGRVTGYWRLKE